MIPGRALLLLLLFARSAAAETTLRLSTEAPDGTGWSRELRAFARDVEQITSGQVRVKWYWGGIAGTEGEVFERITRGQLDGAASAAPLCERLAPTMRALRMLGVFRTSQELSWVRSRLTPELEREFHQAGYALLGTGSLGRIMLFSRTPVRSMAELRKIRVWSWAVDTSFSGMERSLGLQVTPIPLNETGRALEEGRVDALAALTSAMLAFQWYTQVKHALDLTLAFMPGCLVVSERAFARLPPQQQAGIRAAAAKAMARFEDVGRETESLLLGGMFQKQGIKIDPPSDELRNAFFNDTRELRDKWAEVPRSAAQRVLGLLADFRASR